MKSLAGDFRVWRNGLCESDERKIAALLNMSLSSSRNGRERRKKHRIQLSRGLIARYGATPTVILDITDAGARIEHFTRLDVGKKARFRFEWREKFIEVEAVVVACRLHRFAHGDDGATVYQSGLFFTQYIDDAAISRRRLGPVPPFTRE